MDKIVLNVPEMNVRVMMRQMGEVEFGFSTHKSEEINGRG